MLDGCKLTVHLPTNAALHKQCVWGVYRVTLSSKVVNDIIIAFLSLKVDKNEYIYKQALF